MANGTKEKRMTTTLPPDVERRFLDYVQEKHCSESQGLRDWLLGYAYAKWPELKPNQTEEV
jgi:hypothetical protein